MKHTTHQQDTHLAINTIHYNNVVDLYF